MVDVHDGLPKDGFAAPSRLHNILLALAGRLDDSALSEARELVARSHLDDAAELVTGALIAGRIMVRPAEQRELALVLEISRSDAALADQVSVGDSISGCAHRFSRDNEPDRGIAEALDRTLQVLPDLRSVHAVWRNTPAGSVPGPLPQRVVLIEIGPEAHPPAVAFRVDDALRKSGIRAVVEVTGPGAERSEYHEAALAAATPVWLAMGQSSAGSWPSSGQGVAGEPRAAVEVPRAPVHAAVASVEHVQHVEHLQPAQVAIEQAEPEPVQWVESAEPDEPVGRASIPVPSPTFEERENRAASTTEMTKEEMAQLRAAIAEEPERARAMAKVDLRPNEVIDLPELDLDDPQLSERDRQLLRELHAELAERERVEAAKVQTNGAEQRWADGFSGA